MIRGVVEIPNGASVPSYGSVIRITSVQPLDLVASRADIYDAVGNNILPYATVFATRGGGKEYFSFWDGRTRHNSLVGSGTYLMILRISDQNGGSSVKRIPIGVTR